MALVTCLYNLLQSFSKVFDEIWASFFLGFSSILNSNFWRAFFVDRRFIRTFNCHKFSIKFKSGPIDGHDRTTIIFFFWSYALINLDVLLRILSFWKVNRWLWWRFCVDSCRFSFRILIYSSDSIISVTAINCPVSFELKRPQSIIGPPSCFNIGIVFFGRKA